VLSPPDSCFCTVREERLVGSEPRARRGELQGSVSEDKQDEIRDPPWVRLIQRSGSLDGTDSIGPLSRLYGSLILLTTGDREPDLTVGSGFRTPAIARMGEHRNADPASASDLRHVFKS